MSSGQLPHGGSEPPANPLAGAAPIVCSVESRTDGPDRTSDPDLRGVVALVTGASSGLGWAMAEALLTRGAEVLAAARPGPRLEAASSSWRGRGLPVTPLPMDVRDPTSVESAAQEVSRKGRSVDLLVNNAGLGMRTVNAAFMSDPKPFHEIPVAQFQDIVATNLTGYFLVARAFVPQMLGSGSGRVVCVTINRETMVRRGFVPYGPSRAGAEALAMVMSEDLRPHGIAVNLLLPGGATETGMIPPGVPRSLRARLLPPAIMAAPVTFLASPEARRLTGERIVATEFQDWVARFRTELAAGRWAGRREPLAT